jgi:membrane dipeptidase
MTIDVQQAGFAKALLSSAIVWDNHGCMPLREDESFLPQLERYAAAGVNVVSLNVGFGDMSWGEHLKMLAVMRRWISLRPEKYRLVSRAEDVRLCKQDGKLGITFDVEGMYPVQDQISFVQTFYELGVRWMLIAYNRNNAAGGGCLDVDGGLTAKGRAIIEEMQRVGMVLCLSHAGARTVEEALECSANPAIFSHSNPFGETAHPRNVSDALMRACADKGGVVGLSGIGTFLGARGDKDLVERLLSQLRYVIDLVGADHVGLGLDYVFDRSELDDYVAANPHLFPPGLDSSSGMAMVAPEALDAIVNGLARDSLSDTQIRAVLGGNWLRIAEQVWR